MDFENISIYLFFSASFHQCGYIEVFKLYRDEGFDCTEESCHDRFLPLNDFFYGIVSK